MVGSAEQILKAIDEINLMVCVISRDNTLITANKMMLDFAGAKLEELKDIAFWDLPWWQHSQDLQNKLLFVMNEAMMGQQNRFDASHIDSNGRIHDIDFIVKPVMNGEEPEYILAMGYNITDLVSAREALTKRERQVKAFFNYSIEGYIFFTLPDIVEKELVDERIVKEILEQFRIEDTNERLLDIIGQSKIDNTIFKQLGIIDIERAIYQMIHEGSVTLETKIMVNDNKKYLKVILVAIYNNDGLYEGSFAIVRDETSAIENLKNITYLANKDTLTGINNRRSFYKNAENLLNEYKESPISVAMLDIDFFKKVNDTYGHDAGDYVIKTFAEIIKNSVPEACVIARYGGEEFVAILPYNLDQSYKIFERMRERIANYEFKHKNYNISITTSVGLCSASAKENNLENALSKADKALYESKQNGRNQTTIFVEVIHGKSALDPVTGLLTEKSIGYKINKSLRNMKNNSDVYFFIYFEIDIMTKDELLSPVRHYQTMTKCIEKVVSGRSLIGRLGHDGFVIGLKGVHPKTAEDIFDQIIGNIELGFSGMLGKYISIKGCTLNGEGYKEASKIFNQLCDHTNTIF